jgi:hypothetical protein
MITIGWDTVQGRWPLLKRAKVLAATRMRALRKFDRLSQKQARHMDGRAILQRIEMHGKKIQSLKSFTS